MMLEARDLIRPDMADLGIDIVDVRYETQSGTESGS